MKRRKVALAVLVCVGLLLAASGAVEAGAKSFVPAIGLSTAKDPKAAGAEAATKAKAALGDLKPKLVLVYNSGDVGRDPAKLLEGVTSVFDASLVYGCNGYAPLTHESSEGSVAVLALAGDLFVTAAVAETAGPKDDKACGQRIGQELEKAALMETGGRLLLLFGDCHVPRDDELTAGVRNVLGEKFPIIGGAAEGGKLYVQGKLVAKSNLGLMLNGDFTCGFALKKDMSREGLITSARDAVKEAIGEQKDKLALVFVFDCGGRRGEMLKHKTFPKELEAMKAVAGKAPIFGFYGSGEIGRAGNDAPAKGVGYHIATCAILAE